MTDQPTADNSQPEPTDADTIAGARQPAYDAVFAYIRTLPLNDHDIVERNVRRRERRSHRLAVRYRRRDERPPAVCAPLAVTVTRHQCPHCRRTWAKRSAVVAHVARCWHNPAARGFYEALGAATNGGKVFYRVDK